MNRILIIANGDLPNVDKARKILRADDHVICADGGLRHASRLGLRPDLIIGDMDSADKEELAKMRADGIALELFPHDKNETDLELALQRAIELQPQEIVIVAGLGGRTDQTLANIALLADERLAPLDVRLNDGVEEILFCRNQVEVQGGSGDVVSLIPWGRPVHQIHTAGLKWSLNNESLQPEKTRGISNEMIANVASITIGSGLLLIVHKHIAKG